MLKKRHISKAGGDKPRAVFPAAARKAAPAALFGGRDGFTMIELLVVMVLIGIIMAMSVTGFSYYQAGRALNTAERELTTEIRDAQSMAVATGNKYRLDFSDPSRTLYKLQYWNGSGWTDASNHHLPGGVEFDSASIGAIDFYARGNSDSGSVVLDGQLGKTKTVQVDGETANVRTT